MDWADTAKTPPFAPNSALGSTERRRGDRAAAIAAQLAGSYGMGFDQKGGRLEPRTIRTVHVIPESAGEFQSLYFDPASNKLRPNLKFLRQDGSTYFETNELGLKGDPLDPGRHLAVVWGDSVVFGIGHGWPTLLDAYFPDYQFLNGGIEGNPYAEVLQRAVDFNHERPISLNIIMIGWHTLVEFNANVRRDLRMALPKIRNPILATMPTALNANLITKDLSPFFKDGHAEQGFYFCGNVEYSIQQQHKVFEYILERNQIIREVAIELDIPLIDVFRAFDTEPLDDFRRDFFDMLHPRPSAYAKLARTVAAGIQPLIASGWQYRSPDRLAAEPGTRPWLAGIRNFFARG